MREIDNSGYKENISQNIKFYGLCEPKRKKVQSAFLLSSRLDTTQLGDQEGPRARHNSSKG